MIWLMALGLAITVQSETYDLMPDNAGNCNEVMRIAQVCRLPEPREPLCEVLLNFLYQCVANLGKPMPYQGWAQ